MGVEHGDGVENATTWWRMQRCGGECNNVVENATTWWRMQRHSGEHNDAMEHSRLAVLFFFVSILNVPKHKHKEGSSLLGKIHIFLVKSMCYLTSKGI